MKMQVDIGGPTDFRLIEGGSVTWTLIVFPDTGAVPAISGTGLGVMAVIIIGVGGFVFSKFKRQAA